MSASRPLDGWVWLDEAVSRAATMHRLAWFAINEILNRGHVPVRANDLQNWSFVDDHIEGVLSRVHAIAMWPGNTIAVSEITGPLTERFLEVRVHWPSLAAELKVTGLAVTPPEREPTGKAAQHRQPAATTMPTAPAEAPRMQPLALIPRRTAEGPLGISQYPDYPITNRHTAYEWAMALGGEIHPYADCIADLFGSKGELTAGTILGKQARERAIEGWSEQTKAIYYALRAEFEAGRLEPLRWEWCTERPGIDRPDVLDLSRCVFGVDQVLSLIQRRGNAGRLIDELLRAHSAASAGSPPQPEPPVPPWAQGRLPPVHLLANAPSGVTTPLWSWEQAYAWIMWRDLGMVARAAPGQGDSDDQETVENLLAAQKRALRRPWRPSLRARYPKPSDPAAEFPTVRGSIAAFERAIEDGRLTETAFHEFDPAELMRVFPAPAGDAAPLALQFPPLKADDAPVKKTQVAAARAWLAATYSDGIPAGITNKMLAKTYSKATSAPMSERTMRRARNPTADER